MSDPKHPPLDPWESISALLQEARATREQSWHLRLELGETRCAVHEARLIAHHRLALTRMALAAL